MTTAPEVVHTAPNTGNPVELVKLADNWKDAAAGWHCWKIKLAAPCQGCGKANKFYTLTGTIDAAKQFADNPEFNYCDKCS